MKRLTAMQERFVLFYVADLKGNANDTIRLVLSRQGEKDFYVDLPADNVAATGRGVPAD